MIIEISLKKTLALPSEKTLEKTYVLYDFHKNV